MIRFGVHCSIRNGLESAIVEAKRIGCESVQIFTRSPRMWKHGFSSKKEVDDFLKSRKKNNIYPLVVHTPYLPNLATSNKKLYDLSLSSLRDDLAFCGKIKADYMVIHPGAFSEGSTLEEGIKRIALAINKVFRGVKGDTLLLIENVAGGGRRVGRSFGEISEIIKNVKEKKRLGVCLDTAHAFGAGYDISKKRPMLAALREFDALIGLDKLKVIHFNDSMVPLGSCKDRHAHIGKGHIGLKGFKYFIKRISHIAEAGILETPKEPLYSDRKNLKILYKLRKA